MITVLYKTGAPATVYRGDNFNRKKAGAFPCFRDALEFAWRIAEDEGITIRATFAAGDREAYIEPEPVTMERAARNFDRHPLTEKHYEPAPNAAAETAALLSSKTGPVPEDHKACPSCGSVNDRHNPDCHYGRTSE